MWRTTADAALLILPVCQSAPLVRLRGYVRDEIQFEVKLKLAIDQVDFTVPYPHGAAAGGEISLEVCSIDGDARQELDAEARLIGARWADAFTPDGADDSLRPMFHYTAERGWINDPNGLYFDGEQYHLFHQHNPVGWEWGNMHWGHAVSRDMVHWKRMPEALFPDGDGTAFSGSALVKDGQASIYYTAARADGDWSGRDKFVQKLAVVSGEGRLMKRAEPVVGPMYPGTRDPKVFLYDGHYVMALYPDDPDAPNDYLILTSEDGLHFLQSCRLTVPGAAECPDLFPLPYEGGMAWVYWGASGAYLTGVFDGRQFTGNHAGKVQCGTHYAAQTMSNMPDGRTIQFGWLRNSLDGMPFNCMMSAPNELSLKNVNGKPTLCLWPAREVDALRGEAFGEPISVMPGQSADVLIGAEGDFSLNAFGIEISYDATRRTVRVGEKEMRVSGSGAAGFRILVDVSCVEVYAQDGLDYASFAAEAQIGNTVLRLDGGASLYLAFAMNRAI